VRSLAGDSEVLVHLAGLSIFDSRHENSGFGGSSTTIFGTFGKRARLIGANPLN